MSALTSHYEAVSVLYGRSKATSDATDFGLKQLLSNNNEDDDGFCVYFSKYDAELLAVQQ